jgi:hypothetical protein
LEPSQVLIAVELNGVERAGLKNRLNLMGGRVSEHPHALNATRGNLAKPRRRVYVDIPFARRHEVQPDGRRPGFDRILDIDPAGQTTKF